MIEFEPLASSSAGNCYVLRCQSCAPLLIDAGLTFKEIQKAMNFKTSELAGALISHAHGDHSKAVRDLHKNSIATWGSRETIDKVFGQRLDFMEIDVETPSRIPDSKWMVTAFEVVHDEPGTLGFVIDSPEGDRLLYLTDSAYSKHTFEGCTHLAVECNYSEELLRQNALNGTIDKDRYRRTIQTHMSLERLLVMLALNDLSKVETIWLLHLSDQNSDEAMFKEAVQKATGKHVVVCAKRAVGV